MVIFCINMYRTIRTFHNCRAAIMQSKREPPCLLELSQVYRQRPERFNTQIFWEFHSSFFWKSWKAKYSSIKSARYRRTRKRWMPSRYGTQLRDRWIQKATKWRMVCGQWVQHRERTDKQWKRRRHGGIVSLRESCLQNAKVPRMVYGKWGYINGHWKEL